LSGPVSVTVNQASTDAAKQVAAELGLSGEFGDSGMTVPAGKTWADVVAIAEKYGVLTLATTASGIKLTGVVSESSLLPAKSYAEFTADDVMNIKLGGAINSTFIPANNAPVINLTVTNAATGKGISGLPASKFTAHFAQLKADGSTWLNYKLEGPGAARDRAFLPGTTPVKSVIDKGDGSYTLILDLDVTNSNAYQLSQRDDATKDGAKLTYDPKLVHRVAISISTNDAKIMNPATNVAVPSNPNNVAGLVYDFIPETGAVYVNPNGGNFARDLVTMASCDSCHGPLVNHGHHFGGRPDTKICVVCHTVQNKRTGQPSAEFTNMIHTYHMGKELPDKSPAKATLAGVDAAEIGYPQDPRNCEKCHTGKDSIKQVGMKPTEFACKSCHNDGSKTHITTNKVCSECHGGSFGHDRTGSKLTFEIKDATINADGKAVVKFTMNLDGITQLNAFSGQTKTPCTIYKEDGSVYRNTTAYGIGTLVAGYGPENEVGHIRGACSYPTIRVDYAAPQDGINNPDDFNKNVSATLDALWDGSAGTLTYADGVYTATINAAPEFPASGTRMATAKITGYGTFAKSGATKGIDFQNVSKAITQSGFVARRAIVSNDKCNSCHEKLGSQPNFHYGTRNDGPTCSGCHNPNLENSGWSVNASTFIHAIHGRDKRTVPYRWEDIVWTELTYPGVLRNCEQCHVPGSYDFSGAANRAAAEQGRLLFSTAASAVVGAANINRPQDANGNTIYVDPNADYGKEGGLLDTNKTNLVHSPISAACFSCHDSNAAMEHMRANGGSIYETRSTAITKKESCLVCHGPRGADTTLPVTGAVPTIKTVHRWW